MDRKRALNRIVELAYKWQHKHEWAASFKAATKFQHYRDQAAKDRAVVRGMHDGKTPSGMLDLFEHGATRNEELSELYHSQVIEAHQDFCDLTNLLNQHVPTCLEYTPEVNFFSDDVAADYSLQRRDLKKLEAAVRAMLTAKQPIEPTQRFTKQELCDLTGYSDGAVNKRLKALEINTANGGRPRKGDKPFSKEQVQQLLQSIIDDDGSQQFNKNKCEESLKTL